MKTWKTYLILALLTFCPLLVWAATDPATPEQAVGVVNALIPILTPIAVFWLRKVLTKIPRALIAPVVAPLVGVALDGLLALLTGGNFTPMWGAVLGAAGTWLRDVVGVAFKHGVTEPNPDPKLLA